MTIVTVMGRLPYSQESRTACIAQLSLDAKKTCPFSNEIFLNERLYRFAPFSSQKEDEEEEEEEDDTEGILLGRGSRAALLPERTRVKKCRWVGGRGGGSCIM